MEQMIGMTDTAFLGRVGEIELGHLPLLVYTTSLSL